MSRLVETIAGSIMHLVLLVMVVISILLAGKWMRSEWKAYERLATEVPGLVSVQVSLDARIRSLSVEAGELVRDMQSATVSQLEARIAHMDLRIRALSAASNSPPLQDLFTSGTQLHAYLAARLERAAEVEILTQARTYLMRLRDLAIAAGDRRAANSRLEQLRQVHERAYNELKENTGAQARLVAQHWIAVYVPGMNAYRALGALKSQALQLNRENEVAHRAYLDQRAVLDRLPQPASIGAFKIDPERLHAVQRLLQERIGEARVLATRNWFARALGPVMEVLPLALLVVLSVLMVPVLVKTFFFYVLAPLAARRPAVRLDSEAGGTVLVPNQHVIPEAGISPAVSASSHAL